MHSETREAAARPRLSMTLAMRSREPLHLPACPSHWVLPWATLPEIDYATVMAVAERIEAQAIATLDLRRFGAVELRHTPRLLPRDG